MTDNELLLALSDMMDQKLKFELQPIKNDIQSIKSEMQSMKSELKSEIQSVKLFQENILLPRLDTIESCYTDTYRWYKNNADKMESAFDDIELIKKVITEHSAKLQKISTCTVRILGPPACVPLVSVWEKGAQQIPALDRKNHQACVYRKK